MKTSMYSHSDKVLPTTDGEKKTLKNKLEKSKAFHYRVNSSISLNGIVIF